MDAISNRTEVRLSLIVAMAKNRVIGERNQMPWHLPADFAYFKKVTLGHPVIMGRKTFESIGRALPGRQNIVVSRNPSFSAAGIEVASSLTEAIAKCQDDDVFVIGGATLYAEALPRVSRVYLTEVEASPAGDTLFPVLHLDDWREVSRERRGADEKNVHAMEFVVLEKR
ncbi:MAG: type 3 dihydrofolate reductase [Usitatibacteraceae bacterium]